MSSSGEEQVEYTPLYNAEGIECNQVYFVDLINTLVASVLALNTALTGLTSLLFEGSPYFKLAYIKVYKFMISFGSGWGYLTSAVYFLAVDQGFGQELCDGSGYVNTALGYISTAIEFLTMAQDTGLF